MRPETARIHRQLETLGSALGLVPRCEVADSVLSLQLDGAYSPRVDLLWSLPLSAAQAAALSAVTGHPRNSLAHLPIVGIEVEGTTPSTKTMAADVANIAALGTRLGLVVVSEKGERGIYRRAARAVRSLKRTFGDLGIVPMEASWLESFASRGWSTGASPVPVLKPRRPAGGESAEWSEATRATLRELGQRAGFVVAEPYIPAVLASAFLFEQSRRRAPLRHLYDPLTQAFSPMAKSADYLTECQVDLAWLMPLPVALSEFLAEVAALDPTLVEHGVVPRDPPGHVAICGFELETSTGKHAAGGLLNLAAFCVIGVGVVPTQRAGQELTGILRRYQPTLGLRNVRVHVAE